jgi:hypothetical protein
MASKFLVPAGLVSLATAPASPTTGDTYFDTTLKLLRTWNGAAWTQAGLPVYVQSTAPVNPPVKYIWFKTGMPGGGTDLLIETGV